MLQFFKKPTPETKQQDTQQNKNLELDQKNITATHLQAHKEAKPSTKEITITKPTFIQKPKW